MHRSSKHIDIRFHFLKGLSRNGVIELVRCASQDQVSNIMTKALKLEAFVELRRQLGMCMILELIGLLNAIYFREDLLTQLLVVELVILSINFY